MSEEENKITKVNINDLKIEELTLEEQEAFNYFNEDSSEVTFETNIDGDKLLETLGIKKEDNFGVLQYKVLTLLNLIIKQQKEIEKYKEQIDLEFVEKNYIEKSKVVSKDKIKKEVKRLKERIEEHRQLKEYDQIDICLYKIRSLEELLEE